MESLNNISPPYQGDNPSDSERRSMVEYILKMQNREEDFNYIIDSMNPPEEITNICPQGKAKNIRVAVIGGGEAGLCAAYELRKTGCNITLFEASNRIGGRVYTHYFDKSKKHYGELGPMSIPASHETTWHYINLFKLNTEPIVNHNDNTISFIRGERAVKDYRIKGIENNIYSMFKLKDNEKDKAWMELEHSLYNKYVGELSSEIRNELVQIKPKYSIPIEEMDKLNLRNMYENMELSEEAIAVFGYLSGNEQFFRLSGIEMMQQYYTVDFDYTYNISNGMIKLPHVFYDALRDNNGRFYEDIDKSELGIVDFKIGCPVNGIYESKSEGKIQLKYMDGSTEREKSDEFDFVICAIPFPSLRRIEIKPQFTVNKMLAINEMNYETANKVLLYLRNRFWETGGTSKKILGGKSVTDLPLNSIYYPSDHAKPVNGKYGKWTSKQGVSSNEPGVLVASYNWCQEAQRLGNEKLEMQINDVIRYIEQMHELPNYYISENLIDYKTLLWTDVQYIWTAGALSKPRDKTLFSYAVTQPELEDKVFFAGEHISQKHVTQQGALNSGMMAANEVAKRFKY